MPTTNEHISKAIHNSLFSNHLKSSTNEYSDWVVTVYFYTALHLIDAYLATLGKHPPSHHSRDTHIQRVSGLREIYPDYRDLEDLSRDARYTTRVVDQQDIQDSEVSLIAIRNHIRPSFPGEI